MKSLAILALIGLTFSSFARSPRLSKVTKNHITPAQHNDKFSLVCDISKEHIMLNIRKRKKFITGNQSLSNANNKKTCFNRFNRHVANACKEYSKRNHKLLSKVTLRFYKPHGTAKDSMYTLTKEVTCRNPNLVYQKSRK
jgi:hypothetical protein